MSPTILSEVQTFGRLLGFLRPYRTGVILSFTLAGLAMIATVAIPELSGAAVNAIRYRHHRGELAVYAIAIAAAGLVRLALTVGRRLIAGRVSLGVEYDLRDALFARLQELELAFFDGQQTGQLMSRATVDLQAVRFFLGYGLIFVVQSAMTITLAAIAMLILQPLLAVIALAPGPFVVLCDAPLQHAGTTGARRGAAADRRADRRGAGEHRRRAGSEGLRARGPPAQLRFERAAQRVFEQSLVEERACRPATTR